MEALIAAIAAVVAGAATWALRGMISTRRVDSAERRAKNRVDEAREKADELLSGAKSRKAQLDGHAKEDADRVRADADSELKTRRSEIARLEERVLQREETLEAKLGDVERKIQALEDKERNLGNIGDELKERKSEHIRELERIVGLSAAQAKQVLMKEIEDDVRHDSGKMIRRIEDETKLEADRRVRSILATCMQRVAGGHSAETTVSVIELPSDDMKGRIIGKEGRNIRALQSLTGVDFIIDDTPSTVVLSCFDGVRREIARLTLEKLVKDGRIHPASIEDAYYQSRSAIEQRIIEAGEQATYEVDVHGIHPELIKMLGRMSFRTSYGQNVLAHSVEVSRLAALIADELGASSKTAKRAALLHDIGKAVSHEVEGPHAKVGADIARRYKETDAITHAMESHHNEIEPQTVEAVILQIADAVSGARPGARGESLEQYVERLKELEDIASSYDGVDKVFAIQAGREVRIMVSPEDVDDNEAAAISRKVAKEIEEKLEFPGQIKINVIRESRAVEIAH